MKQGSFSIFIDEIIYRTKIIQEFTNNEHQIVYLVQIILNHAQILRFGLFKLAIDFQQSTQLQRFISYLVHPQLYFILNSQQLPYSILLFTSIQLFFLYWVYIARFDKQEQNYILQLKKEQEISSIRRLLLQGWKYIFVFLSDWLGFTLIESCFMILFQQLEINYFCSISSIIIIVQVICIMVIQELFLEDSLHFLPQRKNQFIQSTSFTTLKKLFLLIILIVYSSQIQEKVILISSIAILHAFLSLYIDLIIQTTVDYTTIQLASFMQSIILFVFLEQLLEEFQKQGKFKFLWVLLSLLTFRLLQMYFKKKSFNFKIDISCQASTETDIFKLRNQLSYFQTLIVKQNPELKIVSKILLKHHQKACVKLQCQCRNEDLKSIKIEQILLTTCSKQLQNQLITQQTQSVSFYIGLIQILVRQGLFFKALNFSQKILGSLNQRAGIYNIKKIAFIKTNISLKDKILLKLLQQITLSQIKQNTQNNKQFDQNHNSVNQAIIQYQQYQESQQDITNKFNDIIKLKIDFLKMMCYNSITLSSQKLNEKFLQVIEKIENFKSELKKKFEQIPSNYNQSLLLFLQIELLNDLINSQTINNLSTYMEDFDKGAITNLIYQQISQEFSYIKVKILDEEDIQTEKIIIRQSLIKNEIQSFYDLIPHSLKQIHKFYVRNFFKKGLNKFYLNIDNSFTNLNQGIILPIDMCMDYQFDSLTSSLYSTIFMKKSNRSEHTHYIILDSAFQVQEITQNLYCEILNFKNKKPMIFLGTSISNIIPNFNQFQYDKDQLLGPTLLQFQTQCYNIQGSTQLDETFFGTVNVIIKRIGNKATYYLVEIDHLKRFQKSIGIASNVQSDIEEKEIVDIPLNGQDDEVVVSMISDAVIQQQINLTSRQDSHRELFQSEIRNPISHLSQNSQKGIEVQELSQKSQNNILIDFEDMGSQLSSVAAIKRSAYYPQYLTINSLISSQAFPANIKKFNFFFTAYVLIVVINIIIFASLLQKLDYFQSKVALLSIKFDLYEPIESFLNTRFTVLNYNSAYAAKLITQQDYLNLVTFPKSNLVLGYDDLKGKVFEVLSKPEFQPFLEDRYFTSLWYESTKNQSEKNLTVRTGILQLLNYQYSFKLAYTVYSAQPDSPYFFYSYKNYIQIFNIISELNANVLNELKQSLSDHSIQLTQVTAPFQSIAAIITILYFACLIKQRQIKNKILNFLYNQNNHVIQYEILRLQILQNEMQSNNQKLYKYKLNLTEFDNNLKREELEYQKLVQNRKVTSQNQKKNIKIYNLPQLLILFFHFISYFFVLFFTINFLNTYLAKMKNTAEIYEKLSSSGVNILIINAQKETLYRRTFAVYFTPNDVQDLLIQIDNSLESLKNMNADILKVNQNEYLLDDNSFQLFENISQKSLCQYLPQEYQIQATTLCPHVLGGVLEQGLIATYQFMYNKIYQEKSINNFTSRNNSQIPIRELEAATFTAKIIKSILSSLYNNFHNVTDLTKDYFTIVFVIYIIFCIIVSGTIIIQFNNNERKQIDHLRKVVYLLPQSILVFDDSYQRQMKNLIRMGDLV